MKDSTATGRQSTETGPEGLNDSGNPERPALDCLLRPRSIVIIGASATPGSLGNSVLLNLESTGYAGEIFLVNPKQDFIGERKCFRSVSELPNGVDCAIFAIPRDAVFDSFVSCALCGVRSAIIFAAGFAESGEVGRLEQQRLTQLAREYGIAIEGPNCLGLVNFVDSIPLTFVNIPTVTLAGREGVAILSQSGAMAAVLSVGLNTHGLGVSYSISTGNEAVTSVEDYLEYLIEDEHTRVFVMIVELFQHPRKFLELAASALRHGKYIALLHPGRSRAARESAATHTGALAGDFDVMKASVENAGIILVETLEELLDVTSILMRCRALPEAGTCVLAESGAFKALTLDFCDQIGLPVPALSSETEAALRGVLPEFIPPSNPLDLTAHALVDTDLYRKTLPPLLAEERVGSLMLAIILTDKTTSNRKFPPILDALRAIRPAKPVIFAGLDEGAEIDPRFVAELWSINVPFFPTTERALRALACLTRAGERAKLRKTRTMEPVVLPFVLEPGVLPEYRSKEVLAAAGISVPHGALARTLDQAQEIATRIGFPVALKAQSGGFTHKTDIGGVILSICDADQLVASWYRLHQNISIALSGISLDGVLVEEMAVPGVELIAGIRNDRQWGPMLLVGSGGVVAEALHDVRLLPADLGVAAIAHEIMQLKCAPLLQGFRGSPALDIQSAAEIVTRLGALAMSHPEIQEADINPIVVYPEGHGAMALDALLCVLDQTKSAEERAR